MENWVSTLKAKSGRSLEEWIALVKKQGPKTEAAARDWLKSEHELGTNSAWWLAERAFNSKAGEDDTERGYLKAAPRWVEEQYAGKKAGLRPLYEKLLAMGLSTGKNAKACPCQTIVPLYREHVFAQIKPTTNTRIDLGFALAKIPESKIVKPGGRLIATGGREKKDRITHRIPITAAAEIDKDVEKWLKTAYELDGE